MGQQNMWYTGPVLDVEPQQVHNPPEPYNIPTMLQPLGNRTTLNPRDLPENHGQLPYVNTQHSSELGNTLVMPSPSSGVPMNRNHEMFERRNRCLIMDGPNGVFKRSGSSVTVPVTSEGNRAIGAMGFDFDPVVVRNSSRSGHDGQLVQGVPYLQDMGRHGYQGAGGMRPHQGSHILYYQPPPPPPPPPPSLSPPMLPVQTQNMDGHVHLPSTSRRRSTRTSTTYPDRNGAGPGPRFVGPAPPHGVMVYEARRQQLMIDPIARHHSFPHLRAPPEYVFLPPGVVHIGNTDSGLSHYFISERLKTRTFASFRHHSYDLEHADEEPNFCVICQMEFKDQEKIGILDCCHEYHVKCIRKWLIVKNNCPVCKSTALR